MVKITNDVEVNKVKTSSPGNPAPQRAIIINASQYFCICYLRH